MHSAPDLFPPTEKPTPDDAVTSPALKIARQRLSKLFEYLKAYSDLRHPPVRDIAQQLGAIWLGKLPAHPAVELFRELPKIEDDFEGNDIVLRLKRPAITPCPEPPAILSGWLTPDWDSFSGTVEALSSRNQSVAFDQPAIEHFHADQRRPAALRQWQEQRTLWQNQERAAREALALFETAYAWYGAQEREGERVELLVGDGLLSCPDEHGDFRHPILLQKLELEFNPEKAQPEFIFRKREQPPELYLEFLQALPKADTQQIARCADELKKAEFGPLSDEDTNGFFRRLIQGLFPSRGVFQPTETAQPVATTPATVVTEQVPTLQRQPVIFMRTRRTGPESIFDLVLEDIPTRKDFPSALLQILGLELHPLELQSELIGTGISVGNEDEDILLSKPANREQLEIAKQLAKRDCVLVQGPPGTGKTHTIANLLGHFLAQGKRVLVTAHTPKALRVLRQKVVEPLQPLCISVLHNDKQSQEELQSAVQKIHVRLSQDSGLLERDALQLHTERRRILESLRSARKLLLGARQDEIRNVTIGEKTFRPIDAARQIKEGVGSADWIPSPIELGAALPLTHAEIVELYQTNARISLDDERSLGAFRPEASILATPQEFKNAVEELKVLSAQNLRLRDELWDNSREPGDLVEFDRMLELASKTIEFLRDSARWQLLAIQAGRDGSVARREWDSLVQKIDATWKEVHECHTLVMEHGPAVTAKRAPHELLAIVDEIIAHREAGHGFGVITKLTKRHWHEFQGQTQVNNRPLDLNDLTQLKAVRALLRIRHLRTELVQRWERQMACNGGLACSDLGEHPEKVCQQFVPPIQACLDWHASVWQPLEAQFDRLGFYWATFLNSTPPEAGENAQLRRIRKAILGELGTILQARSRWLRKRQLNSKIEGWLQKVAATSKPEAHVTRQLREALQSRLTTEYHSAYGELVRLKSLETDYAHRADLLDRLTKSAAAWASAIENRLPVHANSRPPGDPLLAWEWRQLHDELDRRANVSLDQLQQRIERLTQQLLEVTAQLVEKRTWLKQIQQTGDAQKQALGAFAAMRNKLTKTGKGVRDAELRNAARREMSTAKDAVPVWIMPLVEVAETFDPRRTQFDVVIIDEASQCDPTSLFALYLGKQAIVVGDDEQVTPVAVGINSGEIGKLIRVFLETVPHKELYDGETSVYELAQIAFGGVIRLTEHFRCAPDIIAFSNSLSYKGEIKPLRESSVIPLSPHVVTHRVTDGRDNGNNLNDAEANTIVSLICAAIEMPEYAKNDAGEPMTFGVVSLVGDKQALKIDSLLRQRLEPAEYRRRQILCGDSAQFQGDERDVMFLSVVDAPSGNSPLPMRQEGPKKIFKKRFNVAASRARNQMWIVHSLNHEVDLQPADYRRRIIEHGLDPKVWERELQKRNTGSDARTKSFEDGVRRLLVERGYGVMPQYQAGSYVIDLVVQGNGNRLAIECDGEQFQCTEKLQEDLERQAVLERLGWTFLRVRGSLFFRDETRALEPVFRRLKELGIVPLRTGEKAVSLTASTDTVSKVAARAAQLRAAWSPPPEQKTKKR
ncbi:MAG: AAA family ATPase [Verrucomicrobia bacterium]|nr:AAA family ATPase [Verrucomicrobiota bacterium]